MREDDSHQVTGEAPAGVGSVTLSWHLIDAVAPPHETDVLLWTPPTDLFAAKMEIGWATSGWLERRNGYSNFSQHGSATHWATLPEPPESSLTAGHSPGTAGGSLEDDLTSSSELSRLRTALEKASHMVRTRLPPGDEQMPMMLAIARDIDEFAREALTSTPLEGEKT